MAVPSLSLSADGLFERERELATVDRLLNGARDRAGAVLTVEGAAGIGKTELMGAIGGLARARGYDVLKARGSGFEAGMAFGVARQLFESMLRSATVEERRALLDGVAQMGARAMGFGAGEPPADQFAAIHGLYWLCANCAERGPLVMLVDDLQWVDNPSLAWLGYLGRRIDDLPLVLVVALRTGYEGGDLASLVDEAGVERLVLGPLSEAGVGAIVRARLDEHADRRFCAACAELTGGNPLFVHELLAAARSEGLPARANSVAPLGLVAPAAVGTSVLTRLGRVGPDAVALARAVAILGPGTEVGTAAALAELPPEAAELTADRLAAAQIFAPMRPLEFFHPLIGAAVSEDMAPGARRLAHRRAAAIVDGSGGSPARVAAHLLACTAAGDPWVVGRLTAAAHEAMEHGAPEVAAAHLRRALAEPPAASERARLLSMLGTAEWRAEEPDAIAHLELALDAAGEDRRTFLPACFQLAMTYTIADLAERAVAVLERARTALAAGDAPLALTLEAAIALVGMLDDSTAPEGLRRAEALWGRLDAVAEPPVYLLVALVNHAARSGRAPEAKELAERAMACAPYPPPPELMMSLIGPLTLIEAYGLQDELCADLLAGARGRGAIKEMVGVCVLRASALVNRGALAEAAADARWALERAEGIQKLQAICEIVRVLVERDELDQADRELQQLVDPSGSRSLEVARFLTVRGRLRAAQGRLEEALADLVECGRRCERLRLPAIAGSPWRSEAALLHAAMGDCQEASRLAREQVGLARAFGPPRTLGVSLRAAGLVESGERGLELLREAVATLERSEAPVELARALTDHGAALRRAGRRVEARAELERGLDLAHRCGARRIATVARGELIAAGAKPRRDAITGRDALTAGELRVAKLAADGRTNREIAQTLFIGTKTASTHLSHVYRKLGITRRVQLGQALAGRVDDRAAHEGTHSVAPAQSIS